MAPAREAPSILVVDDAPDAREMYVLYLLVHGFRVIEAVNGVEAIEQAYSRRPDVILMDLGMPHVDGWEAIRRIKAEPRTRHIRVVAISGHATPDALQRATTAGADAFLTKPCLPEAVLAKINELLSGGAGAP